MVASSSVDEYDDSEDEQESDSDSQGPGQDSPGQSRRAHQTQLGSQQTVATREGTLPSRSRLLDESDAVLEAGEGKSSKRKSRSSEKPRQRISRQQKGLQSRSTKSRRKELKQHLSTAYRDLLNIDIADARRRSSGKAPSLGSSQIGGSYWTAREKDNLFRRIERSGISDLPSLCQSVPTKGIAEIKAYLMLLSEGVSDNSTHGSLVNEAHMSDVPAAFEIPSELESALDAAATALECHVHDQDVKAERNLNGDGWLIDMQAADKIEQAYEESIEQQGDADNELDSKPLACPAELSSTSIAAATKPESLLRPAAFLELSTDIFMNNGDDAQQNWHHLHALPTDTDGPAMLRSAFADLHDLTISLTRRLVQVTIFQALTRLRAENSSRTDWAPSAVVRDADVHATLDVLSMPRNVKQYWATCARRCKVDVYSDSKKFADGRPGTKQGRRLSYDEVEFELGLKMPRGRGDTNLDKDFDEEELDEILRNSEMFTDVSDADSPDHGNSGSHKPARPTRRHWRKRKRALSPADFCRAETAYLEAVDRRADTTEEKRMRRLLHIEAVEDADVSRSLLPPDPGPIHGALIGDLGWREEMEYEAEWEQSQGCVDPAAFREMALAGDVGRRRRQLLVAEVQRRLQEGIGMPSDDKEEYASGENVDEEEGLDEDGNDDEEDVSAGRSDETPLDEKPVVADEASDEAQDDGNAELSE